MSTTLSPSGTGALRPAPVRSISGRYRRTPPVVTAEVAALAGLAGTAYIHLEEMSDKYHEVAYLGVGYGLLSIACIIAIGLILGRFKAGWYLGGATAAATFIGYVLTRTTGLPASTEDIGNWSETIGTWSLIFEGMVVALTGVILATRFGDRVEGTGARIGDRS